MNKLISATALALFHTAPTQAAPLTLSISEDQSQLEPEGRAGYPVPGMMMMSN